MKKLTFIPDAKQEIGTEDPWYALTNGGYLKPEEVIADKKQLAEVQAAIALVEAFIQQCYDDEVIEEA
jgi:hypothetical protein